MRAGNHDTTEDPVVGHFLRWVAAPAASTSTMPHLSDEVWERALTAVRAHRLQGLLGQRARTTDSFDPSRRSAVRRECALAHAVALRVDGAMAEATSLLQHHGIEPLVLKGGAHACVLYGAPDLRPYVDLDLLVHPGEFRAAVDHLVASGCVRRVEGASPAWEQHHTKSVTLRHPSGCAIDVHRTLIGGPYGVRIDPDELFRQRRRCVVAGVETHVLGLEHMALHVCISALLADATPKLIALRDVVQMASRRDLDPASLAHTARGWMLTSVVRDAVRIAHLTLGVEIPRWVDTALPAHRTSLRESVARWSYGGVSHRWRRQTVCATLFVPGLRAKVVYLRRAVVAGSTAA
jgi:hypothetical protein